MIPHEHKSCGAVQVADSAADVPSGVGGEPRFEGFLWELAALLERTLGPAGRIRTGDSPPALPVGPPQLCDELQPPRRAWPEILESQLAAAVQRLESRLEALPEQWAASQPATSPRSAPTPAAPPPSEGRLERTLLGEELAADDTIAEARQTLLAGLLSGDRPACSLAGQLLLFQSVAVERLPQILKDLGEAFYQWRPKTAAQTDPLEAALVLWLNKRCGETQCLNYIEVVQPSDRFDHLRHSSEQGGNEILEVCGWIVARRGSDRPFAKARVTVR